jgi:hypothetical protein
MQVNMKDFLPGSLTVGKEKVHSFALQTTITQRCRDALSNTEHLRAFLFVQVCEISCMRVRNNEDMARIDRLNVHESGANVVTVNETCFKFTG